MPVGATDKLWVFLKGIVQFEPTARAIYAENAKVRMSGRNWLMYLSYAVISAKAGMTN